MTATSCGAKALVTRNGPLRSLWKVAANNRIKIARVEQLDLGADKVLCVHSFNYKNERELFCDLDHLSFK